MFIFDFCMLIPIVRIIIIVEYTIAFGVFYCLFCFDGAKNFCPVLSNQTNWNKFKTLVYVRVNIFVFYGFPVSLVCSDAAFDYHNEIIELIAAYLHLYNNLSAFLSIAEDCTMARLS